MKSKSPFNAYKYNMTGAYADPKAVIQPILGAVVSKSVIGAAEKLGSQLITKESAKRASSEKSFSDLAKSSQGELNKIKNSKVGGEGMFGTDFSSKGMVNSGNQIGEHSLVNKEENPFTKGSPAKHNESAVGSIAGAQPQSSAVSIAGSMLGGKSMAEIKAIGQKPTGSTPGGAGFFGAAAQAARAAAASQELLPPPNQVAESGSYAGTGDRILEMDSNPVGNQSIGRDTDIASQLFGSGQRASMLAMKGTPLHTEGHGGAKNHTHAKPGGYLDQTVAENMGVNNIEDYKPIQQFKGRQIVVNPKDNDTIFSKNETFVNPERMTGITTSPEGTPKYEPKYLNRN